MTKKKYTKPVVVVESFQLNAAVASACSKEGKIPLNYGFKDCTAEDEDYGNTYFGNACVHNVEIIGDGNDEICYHGPIPATEVALYS